MVHLTGEQLPIDATSDALQVRAQHMLAAKDVLIRATRQDFGFNILRWHQYLTSTEAPEDIRQEYTWSNLHERFEGWQPNSDWQLVVEEADRLALEFPNCPHCGSFASLHKILHGPSGMKEELWLCNMCKKQIPLSSFGSSHAGNVNEK
jgi:hypothetical protein